VPAEGLPDVAGDPLRIQQAILNLLGNAIKFTESGTVTLGARPEDDHVLLWVADTGIGISEQDLPLIFEEFRQGASGRKQGRAGSGLGLAITRHLIALMNGKIWAESTLGKGSTFYFTLPIAQPVTTEVEAEGQKG
jgi:signal transduction histidine kinase